LKLLFVTKAEQETDKTSTRQVVIDS